MGWWSGRWLPRQPTEIHSTSWVRLRILFYRAVGGSVGPSIMDAGASWLNADGCHNDRKKGRYHCHRSSSFPKRRGATAEFSQQNHRVRKRVPGNLGCGVSKCATALVASRSAADTVPLINGEVDPAPEPSQLGTTALDPVIA